MDKKTSIIILVILAILGTGYHFLWSGESPQEEETLGIVPGASVEGGDVMTRIEIPYRLEDSESEIIEHMGYTLSYNNDYRVPNWVAYELLETEVLTGAVRTSSHPIHSSRDGKLMTGIMWVPAMTGATWLRPRTCVGAPRR